VRFFNSRYRSSSSNERDVFVIVILTEIISSECSVFEGIETVWLNERYDRKVQRMIVGKVEERQRRSAHRKRKSTGKMDGKKNTPGRFGTLLSMKTGKVCNDNRQSDRSGFPEWHHYPSVARCLP
jgi:hypothetical protein